MESKKIVEALEKLRKETKTSNIDVEDRYGRHRSLEREQYILTDKQRDLLKEAEHKIKTLSKKNKELKERVEELEKYKSSHCLDDEYEDDGLCR